MPKNILLGSQYKLGTRLILYPCLVSIYLHDGNVPLGEWSGWPRTRERVPVLHRILTSSKRGSVREAGRI